MTKIINGEDKNVEVRNRSKIYSVYDSKAELWCKPIFAQNRGSMVRGFSDLCNDKSHPVGQHPEDYYLYEIGEWDDKECMLINYEMHISLGAALDFVKKVGEK